MNRGKYGRMSMLVALAAVMALVLQGCGGDDNSGVEQDLRDQIAMLEGQVSDAEAATAAAMAAQTAAEAASAEAMAAQMAAEAERDAANAARGAAEQAQSAAEMAQADAEMAQAAAEAAQMTAEEAQMAAETAQTVAETERDAATGALSAAEMARDAAKDAEAAAKVAQAQAEAAQMSAEADSADAMEAQMAAEAAQKMAEDMAAEYKMMAEDAAAAQATAEKAAMDAAAAQATAEKAAMDAAAAQKTAEDMAADYKKMADDAMAAQKTAEDARDAAMQAEMTAKQAQADAEEKARMYKAQLDALQGEVDTGEMVDANAAAKALLSVLRNNNVAYTIPVRASTTALGATPTETRAEHNRTGLVGALDTAIGGTDEDTIHASRQAAANNVDALMVEVSSDGMLMAEVEDNAAYKMSDTAPDMIDGWRGAVLTRGTTVTHTVVVYSDIGNDGMTSLLDRYNSTNPTPTMPRTWTVTDIDATTENPTTAGHIPWSEVERPDSETAFAGTGDDPLLTFQGTVHGIPGTFACTTGGTGAQDCKAPARYSDGTVAVTATADGTGDGPSEATTPGDRTAGAWTFVPDDGVTLYTDDANYLTFGWWLLKDAAGRPSDFRAFSTATGLGVMRAAVNSTTVAPTPVNGVFPDDSAVHTNGETIRGSATYSGAAAGKYAVASATADSYEGGHFTADAMLMVNFDADEDGNSNTAADATHGVALRGVIDNFMTGSTARPDWMVNLMVDNDGSDFNAPLPTATLIQDPAVATDTRRMLTSWSTGAAAEGEGEWSATWYGGVDVNAAGNAIDGVGAPDAVIGMFDANIGDAARLQGSFGAMKDD